VLVHYVGGREACVTWGYLGESLAQRVIGPDDNTPRAPFSHWGIIEWLPSLPFTSLSEYVVWFLRQATVAPQRHSLLRGVFIGGATTDQ